MSLEKLFDRSPVLPPDPNISLARYLHTIRQNYKAATAQSDKQRAALLHIRLLQLICKTLPAHPDHSLPENRPLVKELRSVAHRSFEALEAHAHSVSPQSLSRVGISIALFDLFERIATENTARGLCTIGMLAGRRLPQPHVAALIMPSQTMTAAHSLIRYENDVMQLLGVKDLICFGMIHMSPNDTEMSFPKELENMLERYRDKVPEAIAAIIAPRCRERLGLFKFDQNGNAASAHHILIRADSTPSFKLYDLRPLAVVRDEKQKETD